MVKASLPPREFVGIAEPGQTRPPRRRFPSARIDLAAGGVNAWQVEATMVKMPVLRMGIFKRSDDTSGFVVLPLRRVVEPTFSWFGRNRRLAKNFENLAETLATFVIISSIQLA